jgi:hypothetical protein
VKTSHGYSFSKSKTSEPFLEIRNTPKDEWLPSKYDEEYKQAESRNLLMETMPKYVLRQLSEKKLTNTSAVANVPTISHSNVVSPYLSQNSKAGSDIVDGKVRNQKSFHKSQSQLLYKHQNQQQQQQQQQQQPNQQQQQQQTLRVPTSTNRTPEETASNAKNNPNFFSSNFVTMYSGSTLKTQYEKITNRAVSSTNNLISAHLTRQQQTKSTK